jgi:hypothetical protein
VKWKPFQQNSSVPKRQAVSTDKQLPTVRRIVLLPTPQTWARSFETSKTINQSTQRNIQEDLNLQQHRCNETPHKCCVLTLYQLVRSTWSLYQAEQSTYITRVSIKQPWFHLLKAAIYQEGDQIPAPVGNETPFSSGHQECWLTPWATIDNAHCTIPSIKVTLTTHKYAVNTSQCGGRDSSVGIATRYELDGPGIESRWRRDFQHPSRPALWPAQPPIQRVPGHFRG